MKPNYVFGPEWDESEIKEVLAENEENGLTPDQEMILEEEWLETEREQKEAKLEAV